MHVLCNTMQCKTMQYNTYIRAHYIHTYDIDVYTHIYVYIYVIHIYLYISILYICTLYMHTCTQMWIYTYLHVYIHNVNISLLRCHSFFDDATRPRSVASSNSPAVPYLGKSLGAWERCGPWFQRWNHQGSCFFFFYVIYSWVCSCHGIITG